MFTKQWFFDLDKQLRDRGLDSDSKTFDEIKSDLQNHKILSAEEFAREASYVILAGGFSQKTAKIKLLDIVKYIKKAGNLAKHEDLLKIFNNHNKTKAILEIWQNRDKYCDGYYAILDDENSKSETIDLKLRYLSTLPHIGKITANHFARNLGENVVKYDIWIQRLGVIYSGDSKLSEKINNGNLAAEVKQAVDDMFAHMAKITGLPIGYIDVVLWKACQNKLINL